MTPGKIGRPRKVEIVEKPDTEIPATLDPTPEEKKVFEPFKRSEDSEPKPKTRISFQLREDGTLDMDATRAENLRRVRVFFNDPRNRELLGQGVPLEDLVTENDVRMFYDALSGVETFTFIYLLKIDADIAAEVVPFRPDEKNLLIPPTLNVVRKYADPNSWWLRYKDEIALAVLFFMIQRQKFETCKVRMAMRAEARKVENPAMQATPIPQPVGTVIPPTPKPNGQEDNRPFAVVEMGPSLVESDQT